MKPLALNLLLALLLQHTYSYCQNISEDSNSHYHQLEQQYKILKDSSALLHPFVPAVSSVMLRNAQIEINLFNSLLSATKYRDENGDLKNIEARQTYLFNTLQLTYGLSKKSNLNIGVDINYATGRIDEDENSSIFKIFNSGVAGNSRYATGITSIVPRVRWRPIRRNYNFIIQNGVSIPKSLPLEKQTILGWNQVYLFSQFFYNQPLNKTLFLFSQLNVQYGFKTDKTTAIFYTPVAVYLAYLIPKKTVLFALTDYIPIFSNGNTSYTFQLGGGAQYQISKQLLANIYCTKDVMGKSYPDFSSYTISLRYTTK
ncbi:hypothetical protein FC093_22500 [Ilyomonas limi]|uniref:Transporter n=1 Tax=Ilyomonas limi TaxID=2575867 RepID=A0A4U3KQN7_9BACT|nr:hypothetical protein [Ilyomonas limi]TKK64481.1 hypothetical protein FC093_22500 [Ilyomonas limi]